MQEMKKIYITKEEVENNQPWGEKNYYCIISPDS